ncbi:MAG: homoserine kinase [Acidobacteria bacterium]|nr:homoserine kinase [Acidobacteriota bacterium]
MSDRVRVFAPATASNLGPGFDVLGLALERPGDLVDAEPRDQPGVEIVEVTGADSLSTDPGENVVGIAAQAALDRLDGASGVRLWLHKQMPLGSGLGSSAASSVAGAVAVNTLFGGTLTADDLVACALRGEAAASGTAHADNVAPCVLGGIVLIRASNPLDLIPLPVPEALRVVLVHPHAEVLTAEARRLVAEHRFSIGQAVANLGNVAALVAALHQGDLAMLGRSISDALVEPIRAPLVPAFSDVKEAALAAGALGCSISGSGPSVLAFADSDAAADSVATAMEGALARAGVSSDRYVGPVNAAGARVVDQELAP